MLEAAWVAGFFDGEGCVQVGYRKRKNNRAGWFALSLTITNTHLDALEQIKAQYGGFVSKKTLVEGRQQAYFWRTADLNAERFLRAMLPYLVVKRRQVELALAFRDLGQRKPFEVVPVEHYERASEISEAIRRLNGRHPRKNDAKIVPLDYVEAASPC